VCVDNVENSLYTWSQCGAISERGCLPAFLAASVTVEQSTGVHFDAPIALYCAVLSITLSTPCIHPAVLHPRVCTAIGWVR
jgi:hypothetical protein